jgi:predicted PurR-regulated permease PerM
MSDGPLARRALVATSVAAGVVAVALLLVRHPEIPILVFGGVLGAVFLDALGRPLMSRLGVTRPFAIGAVVALLVGLAAATAWLLGPQVIEQGRTLAERVPQTVEQLRSKLPRAVRQSEVVQDAVAAVEGRPPPQPRGADGAPAEATPWKDAAPWLFGSIGGLFSSVVGVLGGALALFALAIFLALQPALYRDGALRLVPASRRARLAEVMDAIATALRGWLVGRAVAMVVIAAITWVGLAVIGTPLALSLALIAGVLNFIPYVGPLLAAVPALLVALAASPEQALAVAGLYWAVQLLENYVVTPVAQGKAIALPAAVLLVSQVGMGILLGGLGLLVATPLAVAVIVTVQALYVQDVLGEPVRLLGEPAPEDDPPKRRVARSSGV